MSKEFYHPYQFVPVTGKVNGKPTHTVDYQKIVEGKSGHPIRHDYWEAEALHGRLICKLHLHTPTVVGGQQHRASDNDKDPAVVKPYCRDEKPAIPGNSLRGMIGSVLETLSQSALRVLEDKHYSVRKPMDQAISAVGILVKSEEPENREFDLIPLTVPIIPASHSYPLPDKWINLFFSIEKNPCGSIKKNPDNLKNFLPAYVAGYRADFTSKAGTFLAKNYNCFQLETNPEYFYALLEGREAKVIGEKPLGNIYAVNLLTEEEWEKKADKNHYTKGIVRVLGVSGKRGSQLPKDKKYELFIPWREETKPDPIPVSDAVLDQFRILANEQAEASEKEKFKELKRPFMPQGYPTWEVQKSEPPQHPKCGDVVFFDINENGHVSEISFSSIWRKAIEGSCHDFFSNIDHNLLPFGADKRVHKEYLLTPAETLLGVVEEVKREAQQTDKTGFTRALASRVRFSDARAINDVELLESQVLKILSSPKTPAPAMYFHLKNNPQGDFIAKTQLNRYKHEPNGRKVYLHHQPNDVKNEEHPPWKTQNDKNNHQKMRCNPMQAGQDFYFHIDFDNLSEAELGLLLSSLRPADTFQHRLGLGKSLGLGSVSIDIAGAFLIDRQARYSQTGWEQMSRYHHVWCNESNPIWTKFCKQEYEQEKVALTLALEGDINAFLQKYRNSSLVDKHTLEILNIIGNPASLEPSIPVKPPLLNEQVSEEEETFKWFVANENDKTQRGHSALPSVTKGKKLPTLATLTEPKQKN